MSYSAIRLTSGTPMPKEPMRRSFDENVRLGLTELASHCLLSMGKKLSDMSPAGKPITKASTGNLVEVWTNIEALVRSEPFRRYLITRGVVINDATLM